MVSSGIIDVAIGVTFVFILVSTLCSAIREGIESCLKTRATYLEYAIRELLQDRAGTGITTELFKHPWINGLYRGDYEPRSNEQPSVWRRGRNLPSYIPSKNFALALLDIAARGRKPEDTGQRHDAASPLTLEGLRTSTLALPSTEVRRAILAAIDMAHGDIDRARANLEAWYDSAMDRVSGWYKRSTQYVLFAIALGVVALLNINTITIADALYRNSALREATIAAAEHAAQPISYAEALKQFDRLRIPIGWDGGWGAPRSASEKALLSDNASAFELWNDGIAPIFGLLLTAFAAMLGAPFWFDVMNKITFVRAALKPRRDDAAEAARAPVPMPLSAASILSSIEPENDVDCCASALDIEHVAEDDELPAAIGGVA